MSDLAAAPSIPGDGQPAPITRSVTYDDLPEYLTPAEAQAYLSVSRTTIYELLRRSEIRHVRFGRLIRIPKTALRG
jgi:excisionase family DNA binding protein